MASGGYRPNAGRPKKSVTEKIINGNPSKRKIEVLEFEDESKVPKKPANWLSPKAKEIWKEVYEWLEKIGCTKGILPYNLDEYSHCKSRWLECEQAITTHGFILKDSNGRTINNPCISMAQNYLRQTNDVWLKIYAVVRETKLKEWNDDSPNDDIMENILRENTRLNK